MPATSQAERPPPVPPKDAFIMPDMSPYSQGIEADLASSMARSASKRKRNQSGDFEAESGPSQVDRYDTDVRTPKRSRYASRKSDVEASDEATPGRQRSVRRKKGIRNLSLANIRHAAQEQAQAQSPARESRFQEGSLTNKPCEKPPSIFTRIDRTDSGNMVDVDGLMEEYHADASAEIASAVAREKVELPSRLAAISQTQPAKRNESNGFFRFGRHFAQSFRPAALWNKMWKDNEQTRETTDNASERRENQKAEAEARYAEMKQAGQFGLRPVDESMPTPTTYVQIPVRDEANADHDADDSFRSTSAATQIIHSSQVPYTVEQLEKATKSRPRFKRPSLSNIKDGLKRMGSDLNLAASSARREPSSSASPEKTAPEHSVLHRSQSRHDLKKQQKLTKRVSDLEFKLQQARKELGDALSDATPMPSMGRRYERFTPSTTLKRPRFVPSKLPSLPSERILMAREAAAMMASEDHMSGTAEQSEGDLSALDELEDDETTVSALKPLKKAHVSSVLDDGHDLENHPPSSDDFEFNTPNNYKPYQPFPPRSSSKKAMDPNPAMTETTAGNENVPVNKQPEYATLDAKLKALEHNTKLGERAKKPKKRKSAVTEEDRLFKPEGASDDDSDWTPPKETPKKKRKSTGSTRTKRSSNVTSLISSSPIEKLSTKGIIATADFDASSPRTSGHTIEQATAVPEHQANSAAVNDADGDGNQNQRDSLDSHALEPLAEEEEPVQATASSVTQKDAPSMLTAGATSARHVRTRSSSPSKAARRPMEDVKNVVISKPTEVEAADKARTLSSPPSDRTSLAAELGTADAVIAVPGSNGVPKLPKGAHGSFESLPEAERQGMKVEVLTTANAGTATTTEAGAKTDDFEWPEDVF